MYKHMHTHVRTEGRLHCNCSTHLLQNGNGMVETGHNANNRA